MYHFKSRSQIDSDQMEARTPHTFSFSRRSPSLVLEDWHTRSYPNSLLEGRAPFFSIPSYSSPHSSGDFLGRCTGWVNSATQSLRLPGESAGRQKQILLASFQHSFCIQVSTAAGSNHCWALADNWERLFLAISCLWHLQNQAPFLKRTKTLKPLQSMPINSNLSMPCCHASHR